MFGGVHYYHGILRKSVSVFGTLFNNIIIKRVDSDGLIKDTQRVPLAYGPKQKFLARIDQQRDLEDPKVAIKLPRMSFEITNLQYDSVTKVSRFNKITTDQGTDARSIVGQITPYIVDMQLNIMAKNQDDALQILEQIVPNFTPTYTLAVKYLDNYEGSFDTPITLNSISLSDDYEGDYTTRRVLVYTLDFSMKIKFFGSETSIGVINEVIANLSDPDKTLYVTGSPDQPVISTSFISSSTEFTIKGTASSLPAFQVGETIVGLNSGIEGEVNSITFEQSTQEYVLTCDYVTGYFELGETIQGDTSGTSAEVSTYTVG